MEVKKTVNGTALTINLDGRIDTTTAPKFEAELKSSVDGITELYLDFAGVEYISSAGLRVLLKAQKIMNRQGKMVISHVSDAVMEVFDVTGFADILNIEGE